MRNLSAKISLIILIGIIISACNTTRRVPEGRHLLMKNELIVNGKNKNDDNAEGQVYQKPNSSILGYRLRLNLFNMAKKNPDSSYQAKFARKPRKYERLAKLLSKKQVNRLGKSFWYYGFHNFLKKSGEAPVIIDEKSTRKSVTRLKAYYFNNGFFDVAADYDIDTTGIKKGKIKYGITTGNPYVLDSISRSISTPALDSLYEVAKAETLIKSGKQYKTDDFDSEKNRITSNFRNRGVYHFQQNYVRFTIDTVGLEKNKANAQLVINDYSYREGDSTKTAPFKIYRISRVNIFTADPHDKTFTKLNDSTIYNNFHIYSTGKLRYKPKALTDAVFINKDNLFADFRTTLTSRYLSNLRMFSYPSIQYVVDSTGNGLISNIYLVSKPKYTFSYGVDLTHSNIQDFGISGNTSLAIRNVFRGAETLEISGRGNIGSSVYFANPGDNFFNVFEYGADVRLIFPRIFFPIRTERIIPKNMIPSTSLSFGIAKQQNIGLDKESFTGALSYNWTPKRFYSARFDLFNIQYVNNVNVANYFRVYRSSYDVLNDLAHEYSADPSYFNNENDLIIGSGTSGFISDVTGSALNVTEEDLKTVRSIEERRRRLTENNLIFATNYSFSKTTRTDLQDDEFHIFRTKIESAGNFLTLLSALTNNPENSTGSKTFLDVAYSQYIKTEFEYVKHWDLRNKQVFAVRAFGGIAIPYGNSESVPFSRSYFAGGPNDNRAWKSYALGPGRARTINDFNEANMKLAFSAEYRFNLFGGLNAALFADAGNIWNVLDNITDEKAVFDSFRSLGDIAVGSGFGFRYDFNFFVLRLDVGFKTYDPADETQRWLREYNFSHSVLNIGINYPF